ncbi:histidine kinase [Vallitalea longa]|uniref:Histidine kinase n=1 Tax=Vallitalea longa TaxID=2936439 RepID=A0A9W5YEZ9_9FIRM|nr:sensor histidine kinase [Vallitalea longa]GKX30729.1 histidine kinase [Vallitalea longa]
MTKITNKVHNIAINTKIFLGIILTSAITISLIFIITSIIIVSHQFDLTTTSSINELNYISKQLDFSLTTVENFGKTIAVDPIVQEITSKYNEEGETFTYLDSIALKNRVDTIIQSTKFIHSVSIYSADRKLLATTDTSATSPDIDGIDITTTSWISREKMLPYLVKDTINVLSYLQSFYSYQLGQRLGYIEISIPETAISDIYSYNSKHGYGNQFILNQYGLVQSTDGFYKLYQYYINFLDVIDDKSSGYTFIDDHIVFYKYFPKLDWYIMHEINRNFFLKPFYTIIFISALIALCGIILAIIFSHRISKTITSPIHKLIGHIQYVIKGNWEPMQEPDVGEEIGFLYHEFNKMLTAQSKLTNDLIKEQKMKQKLSLDLLQQQINPHFLYNALDNICSLAEVGEKDKLTDIVMNLSQFYREILSKGSSFITIGNELSIIQSYLHIMLIRYYNKFEYTINCPESLKNHTCLKLLLQPIVENSIYHGIKEIEGKGIIEITVSESDNDIIFTVTDNGIGITKERLAKIWSEDSHSFGIINIDKRVKLYYGNDYGLDINSEPTKGCTVTVTISKREKT